MSRYRTIDGDVADVAALRALGSTAGTTEALLDGNPGLADLGPILPAGLELAIPTAPAEQPARPLRLWD